MPLVRRLRAKARPYFWSKIGRIIGLGGEHVIFAYEDSNVIKFSWHVSLSGKHGVKKLLADYHIGEHYMGEYLLPIDIRTWNFGHSAVEIQKKIKCRPITKDDLKDEGMRTQLRDILARNQRMVDDLGYGCDLFGFKGLVGRLAHHEISNVLITDGNILRMVDFTTLTIRPRWFEWPLVRFIHWAQKRQAYLLATYWNTEMV